MHPKNVIFCSQPWWARLFVVLGSFARAFGESLRRAVAMVGEWLKEPVV